MQHLKQPHFPSVYCRGSNIFHNGCWQHETEKKTTTMSIIVVNIYSCVFIQMSLLAKEISERQWVLSQSSQLSGIWQHPGLHFKASITHHHKPMEIVFPSSLCVEVFTGPVCCFFVISACFGMKIQQNTPVLWLLNNSVCGGNSLYFCCLEISFRQQEVFGMLWCVGINSTYVCACALKHCSSEPLVVNSSMRYHRNKL